MARECHQRDNSDQAEPRSKQKQIHGLFKSTSSSYASLPNPALTRGHRTSLNFPQDVVQSPPEHVKNYRIGPGPIEDCLLAHPAVRMAAVVGVPDTTHETHAGGWFIVALTCSLSINPMSSESANEPGAGASHSPLYAKLLGETAKIDWCDLERFFAQGKLLSVARDLDLVSVAEAITGDDATQVTQWLSAGHVERMQADTARDYAARNPELWAVVVSPWVCVQERG